MNDDAEIEDAVNGILSKECKNKGTCVETLAALCMEWMGVAVR